MRPYSAPRSLVRSWSVIVALACAGCAAHRAPAVEPAAAFHHAIEDAAFRDGRYIYNGLVRIADDNNDLIWRTPDHQVLLALTFVRADIAAQFYRNADGTPRRGTTPADTPRVWVTLAPELQRFCRRLGVKDPTERVKQFLGLNPMARYDSIVELWVDRDDVFRPCPDPEVTDSVCELQSRPTPPMVKNIPDYPRYLLSLHEQSYRPDGAPWTGLGYTYDWAGGKRSVGASEFVLVPDATFEVKSIEPLGEYCSADRD